MQKPVQVNNDADRWSEHGLGHLLNSCDPESANRDWISQVWLNLVRKSLRSRIKLSGFFLGAPAMSRISITSPAVLRPMAQLNENKSYSDQIKPFNFLLSPHVNSFKASAWSRPRPFSSSRAIRNKSEQSGSNRNGSISIQARCTGSARRRTMAQKKL